MKKSENRLTFLNSIPLFASCEQETLAELNGCAKEYTVPSGEKTPDETDLMLGILLEGSADILSTDEGKSVILRTLRPCDVFGAASLFAPEKEPLSHIRAKDECRLLFWEKQDIRRLLAKDEGLLDAYLAFLASRVAFLNRKIRCFTAGSAERRRALWLLSEEHDCISLSSFTALSDMLDIGRASLYRALDKLENEGWITHNGREIRIADRFSLQNKFQ